MPTIELPTPPPFPSETSNTHVHVASKRKTRNRTIWQFLRFGLVGCLNTTIDLLVLNCLLQLWPTQNMARLLLFNTIAYAFGALNSFALNRHWTFRRAGRPKARSFTRFLLMTLAAIVCNDLILWFMGKILHPAHLNVTLWANSSKVAAIGGTILISYLGMRLWVFVQSSDEKRERFVHPRTWRHEELPDKTASDHAFFKGNTGAMIHADKIPAAILPDGQCKR
jgi:putative flippase GtrA